MTLLDFHGVYGLEEGEVPEDAEAVAVAQEELHAVHGHLGTSRIFQLQNSTSNHSSLSPSCKPVS